MTQTPTPDLRAALEPFAQAFAKYGNRPDEYAATGSLFSVGDLRRAAEAHEASGGGDDVTPPALSHEQQGKFANLFCCTREEAVDTWDEILRIIAPEPLTPAASVGEDAKTFWCIEHPDGSWLRTGGLLIGGALDPQGVTFTRDVREAKQFPSRASARSFQVLNVCDPIYRKLKTTEHAYVAPPPPAPKAPASGGVREAVARIVDPGAFHDWTHLHDWIVKNGTGAAAEDRAIETANRFYKGACDVALAKAAHILALFPDRGDGWRPTHRHVKRGSDYQVIDEADLQTDAPISDYAVVTVYRGADGRLWARPASEFNDGRFEPLPSPPEAKP